MYQNKISLSRYVRPSITIHIVSVESCFLDISGRKPEGLSVIDVTEDDDFNY